MPLLDEYLEFLGGRYRPNTVLAFTAVKKTPRRVRPADVLSFMTDSAPVGKAAFR